MFYEEAEISELVICPYCKNKYDDPRIIECGTSFCMPCIEFLTKGDTNGFQCPVCKEFHQQPQNGYLKNTTLAKLCEKKANKVSRSPLADALDAQLDELKQNMDKLAKENDLGSDKIKEYCDGLRNEVQLHLEESTESLKKQSLELIQKIDEYESETRIKFDAKANIAMDDFLWKTRQFHEKWADYLKKFKIDDEELKLASNESKKLQNKLNKESELFLSKVFSSNILKFTKSTPVFGSLVNEGLKHSYKQVLKNTRAYNWNNRLNNITKVISFNLISNGKMCIAFRYNDETMVRMAVFDKDLNQLAQMPCPLSDGYRGFQVVELNKALLLCLFDPRENANYINASSIKKYEYDLKFISQIEFDFQVNSADVHEDELYLLATSSDRQLKHIYIYDVNLKLMKNIKLGIREGLPFYVPMSVTKMRVADDYFVFLTGTDVLLMDRLDGEIKRAISIFNRDFVLDLSNDRILTHDGKTEKLVCFDFEGESFEFSFSSTRFKNIELVDYDYQRFVFFDRDSLVLIF